MLQQNRLLDEFVESLAGKAEATVSTYRRELRQFLSWITARPGNGGRFRPEYLTKTALEIYLVHLERSGHSISHRARVKSAVASFARWLIEEKNLLRRNPACGVTLPPQPLLAPRQLTPDQCYILRSLVEREDDPRSEALFALGY